MELNNPINRYSMDEIASIAEEWGWKTERCLNDFEDAVLVSTHRHEDYFGQFYKEQDGNFGFRFRKI